MHSHQLVNEADAALISLGIDMDLIPLPLSLYIRCHKNFYLVRFAPPFSISPHQQTPTLLQVFANRVIGEAAWAARECGYPP